MDDYKSFQNRIFEKLDDLKRDIETIAKQEKEDLERKYKRQVDTFVKVGKNQRADAIRVLKEVGVLPPDYTYPDDSTID